MADDPEKRFHSIMDKLFHAPESLSNPSSSSSAQLTRGRKRPNPETALALVEPKTGGRSVRLSSSAPADAPTCRPWDRGDLMRRLATFKSMTWFAKPKVVSAVICARRGWINVDMDIIACEACGARLLFTAPSSWSQQQVEKAALVFSLELDKGHKLPCPWIDNACEERLAEFPPTPPEVLVDKYRERSVALFRLLALPAISYSAIEYMRSPQLEEFLRQIPMLEYGNGSTDVAQIESLEDERQAGSASLYYQAQKLLSLCGWEPRALPYVVDCQDRPKQLLNGADCSSSVVTDGQSPSINVHSVAMGASLEANEDTSNHSEPYTDPNSTVLDCRLCGACVGLWAFSMVPRPLEFFRVVGSTEVNKRNSGEDSGDADRVDISSSNATLSSTPRSSEMKLTIAGGPPPTKQNFKATISLPLIGRNLRARFSHDYDSRNYTPGNLDISSEETVSGGSQVSETSFPDPDSNNTIVNGNDTLTVITFDSISEQQNIACAIDSREGVNGADVQKTLVAQDKRQGDVTNGVHIPEKKEIMAYGKGKGLRPPALDKAMEFDPIKQHRHFCPWIVSTSSGASGWQQTLAALQRQKENSHPTTSSPPSSSFIKVDDPITSVRKLFMSPSPKRLKPT